jgi:predicted dienelactone hydrolase
VNRVIVFCILLVSFTGTSFATQVGFQQFKLSNESRPLNVTVWYPTLQNSPLELIADNIAFSGTQVIKDALITPKQHPLVILSHGYGGNWRNLNWLADELVKKGFIVAAPEHPGTTTFNRSALQASQWWERPRDLTRVLDFLLEDSVWRAVIDDDKISAIGHSLGGWSVMLLVGAEFERSQFLDQCRLHPNPRVCGLANELGLDIPQPKEPKIADLFDHRIKNAVILDLGQARSFSIESMRKVTRPVLILAAGVDIGDLPQAMESGYLAEHLPLSTRRYKVYEQAMHFSFIQLCKPKAVSVLEEEVAGDGIICKDGKSTNRQALHEKFFEDIYQFIQKN